MKWLALLFALLFPTVSFGQANECLIEFALDEQLTAPAPTRQTISVIPYDNRAAGESLRLCWADSYPGYDNLGISFQTAPADVTCEAADIAWSANQRQDFVLSGLTANTRIDYKIQCDAPDTKNPSNLWTNRPIYSFTTLPAVGDTDFTFTVLGDTHLTALWMASAATGGGACGTFDQQGIIQGPTIGTDYANIAHGMGAILRNKGRFHVDLGDTYMGDSSSGATCGKSVFTDPPDGPPELDYSGMLYNAIRGWPTRFDTGTFTTGIQTSSGDTTVRANAESHIFTFHRATQQLWAQIPFVFAWGNHDSPRTVGFSNNVGSCNRWNDDDDQAAPYVTSSDEHMGAAWRAMIANPNTAWPNSEPACDDGGVVGDCDQDGYYYTFTSGLAQFWVLNPFEAAGDGGVDTDTPWSLTGRYPETPADWSLGQIQFQWFSKTFRDSTAKWKFIFLHHLPGGVDSSEFTGGSFSNACYHYGRGGALATTGRRCDANLNGLPDDPGAKLCEIDGGVTNGYTEAQDTRPAPWKATYGGCPSGQACLPTPYNNRTAAMAGNALYGQPALHAVIKANQDSGGSTFFMQGHDHLTVGGCKFDSDGCTEIYHILVTQPTGTDDGGEPPPGWNDQGIFSIYADLNGDTVPDYKTDGSPYDASTDVATNSIREAGTQIRGVQNVSISNEGVKIQHIATDRFDYPSLVNNVVMEWNVGTEATYESDFDGVAGADRDSKNDTPTITFGNADCVDELDLGETGELEGTQMLCSAATAAGLQDIAVAALPAAALYSADLMLHPTVILVGAPNAPVSQFRLGAVNQSSLSVTNTGTVGGYNFQLTVTGGTDPQTCSPEVVADDHTYMVRHEYDAAADRAELWMDRCDPADDDCNGRDDINLTPVFVPTWGTGSWCHVVSDGATAPTTTDTWRARAAGSTASNQWNMDALGICAFRPGPFKCGDNFE